MVQELTPADVREKLNRDEPFDLIDVRDAAAYADGHLPGAEHVTIEELEETVVDREWADEVVLYCYVGDSSVQAARLVEQYGNAESVASMTGGYEAWNEASGPTAE